MKARFAASVVLAAAVVLGTAGCNLIAPQATTQQYEPSDGVGGSVGAVDIRNAMLITKTGEDATLVAAFVTQDGEPHRVTAQYETSDGEKKDLEILVQPDGLVGLSFEDAGPKVMRGINVVPGSLFPVYFQYGDETGIELKLPVLTGEIDQYSTLLPTPPEPSVTPTPVPLPSETIAPDEQTAPDEPATEPTVPTAP